MTVQADITPVIVNIDGRTFSGSDVLDATLASPQFALDDYGSKIKNLESQADPTHLPVYLTDSVLLHIGQGVTNCCVIGFHGTRATGPCGTSTRSATRSPNGPTIRS